MLLKLCFVFLNVLPLFDSVPLDGTLKSAKLSRARTSGKSSVSSSTDNIFPQDCGVRKIRNTSRGRVKRIVGGSQSSQGKWPWQAALFFKGTQYCGGAIISSTWILTTAHCFNPHTSVIPADWTVVLGDHHIKERNDKYEQRRKVVNITIHEGYKSMHFEGIYDTPPKNDVAILKLDKPLTFTDFVQPLCLPRPDQVFAPNEECYVAGWGHTQWNGTQPDILREAKVRTVSRKVCNQEKSYNGTIHDTAMCAGFPEGRIDACEYDSGGPLVCTKCGRYYALGLVSWGDQCALPHKYGVYADLRVLTPWVKEKIMKYETG